MSANRFTPTRSDFYSDCVARVVSSRSRFRSPDRTYFHRLSTCSVTPLHIASMPVMALESAFPGVYETLKETSSW
jgi:hypothetical protein